MLKVLYLSTIQGVSVACVPLSLR